jgi:hypothetical protein
MEHALNVLPRAKFVTHRLIVFLVKLGSIYLATPASVIVRYVKLMVIMLLEEFAILVFSHAILAL